MSLRWNDDEASEQEERDTKYARTTIRSRHRPTSRANDEGTRIVGSRLSRGRMASPSIGYAMTFPIVTKTRDSTHARISQQETITRYEKTTSQPPEKIDQNSASAQQKRAGRRPNGEGLGTCRQEDQIHSPFTSFVHQRRR